MRKIVLIDGTNLMFRSYYATAYTGVLMKNSKGQVTNALYGFTNMLNKIIEEEKPEYLAVAFDIGKTFRHEYYKDYKAGRKDTPIELKSQIPIAKDLLNHMGIKYLECSGYEADDIIGTLAKRANLDPEWDALVITSDHDYLQLITDQVEVKLLHQKGFTKYKPNNFKDEYGIDPIKVIDLKALMGDSSDNIPGIAGIGEKTALKLLVDHGSLDGIYNDIDSIKGKLQEKLINGKDDAYFSYKLATIMCDVPLDISFSDMKYEGPKETLDDFFYDLEFYSLLKHQKKVKTESLLENYKVLNDVCEINKDGVISYYIECSTENYHTSQILGMGLYDGKNAFFVEPIMIDEVIDYIKDNIKYTFDLKKNYVLLKNLELNTIYDMHIAAYLLNKTLKDDIAFLMNNDNVVMPVYKELLKNHDDFNFCLAKKAKYIYDLHDKYIDDLKAEDMYELFTDVEMPLTKVLAKMELNGIRCDSDILNEMKLTMQKQLDEIIKEIYELSGVEFNVASPKQLGDVLFNKLGLPYPRKKVSEKLALGKTGSYLTNADVLEKVKDLHPIVPKILEYRNLAKIYSTYIEGMNRYIMDDGKIHTIYKQTLTRTGRLSSVEPNLQNLPARDEQGKLIRKAFLPCNDLFLSSDYSQIELRILAHISKEQNLIDSFNNNEDIHSRVAADIFNKDINSITKSERRIAKSVIFGIVYGISGFGLGDNIGISSKEANEFIKKYYELYPNVKNYMDMVKQDAYDVGFVTTLYNRKRHIEELNSSNYMVRQSGERMALNTPIQGSGADILKMAMIKIDKEIEKRNLKSKMLLQIHDELVFDCLKEEKEELSKLVKDIMENVVDLSVKLAVDIETGTDLYDTK